MMRELFGLTISESPIAESFQRTGADPDAPCKAIQGKLCLIRLLAATSVSNYWLPRPAG